MNILIITPYHMNPPSPRVIKEIEIFKKNNINVLLLKPLKEQSILGRNLYLKQQLKKIPLDKFNKVIVFDLLTLLFVHRYIPKQKLIYEVLDSFPEYYSYKLFKNTLISVLSIYGIERIEKYFSKHKINKIIVNSYSLFERFKSYNNNIFFIPYTSPFEDLNIKNDPSKKEAFIYIGLFSEDKGAKEILSFSQKYPNKNTFIVGDIQYKFDITKFSNITIYNRMHINSLKTLLTNLMSRYFLYGFSLIKPKNRSYAIQEANKDIDYLSLGIPIIGNERIATYEKIQKGAGILLKCYNEKLTFQEKYKMSYNCKKLYKKYYSNAIFENKVLNAIK